MIENEVQYPTSLIQKINNSYELIKSLRNYEESEN